jgi:hypothetical protein
MPVSYRSRRSILAFQRVTVASNPDLNTLRPASRRRITSFELFVTSRLPHFRSPNLYRRIPSLYRSYPPSVIATLGELDIAHQTTISSLRHGPPTHLVQHSNMFLLQRLELGI